MPSSPTQPLPFAATPSSPTRPDRARDPAESSERDWRGAVSVLRRLRPRWHRPRRVAVGPRCHRQQSGDRARSHAVGVGGELGAEGGDVGLDRGQRAAASSRSRRARAMNDAIVGHLRLLHPLRRHRRGADAHAARDERAARVVGDRVLVERDAGLVERRSGRPCRSARRRTGAGRRPSGGCRCRPTRAGSPRSASASASADALVTIWWAYSVNDGWAASRNAIALPAMTCSSGPPCQPGNTALSIALACSALRQDAAATRAAQRLVGRERDDVGERHRVRVRRRRRRARRGGRCRTSAARRPRRRSPGTARDRGGAGSVVVPATIIFGRCSRARSRTSSMSMRSSPGATP